VRHARQKTIHEHSSSSIDAGETLDESKVLEHLETDLSIDEDYRRIVGIGNGVAIGAVLWSLLIATVLLAL